MSRARLEGANSWLERVHDKGRCAGEHCTIHNRSEHNMRGFPQHWRGDRGIMERRNPFGGACPDPDSPWPKGDANWVHGCLTNPYTKAHGMCGRWQIDGVDAAWVTDALAVTKDGRVWSFRPLLDDGSVDTTVRANFDVDPVVLPTEQRGGNAFVQLPPFRHKVQVRKIVLTGWRGPRQQGYRPDHIDGDKNNVALDNLRWVVMRTDAVVGSRKDRLSMERVREIRTRHADGQSVKEILAAMELTVKDDAIERAITGARWGWVDDPGPMSLYPATSGRR